MTGISKKVFGLSTFEFARDIGGDIGIGCPVICIWLLRANSVDPFFRYLTTTKYDYHLK